MTMRLRGYKCVREPARARMMLEDERDRDEHVEGIECATYCTHPQVSNAVDK